MNDSLVVITSKQLKITNLIFTEHTKLKLECKELNKQINLNDSLYSNFMYLDSIRTNQLTLCRLELEKDKNIIKSQQIKINNLTSKNYIMLGVGCFSFSLLLILYLLK